MLSFWLSVFCGFQLNVSKLVIFTLVFIKVSENIAQDGDGCHAEDLRAEQAVWLVRICGTGNHMVRASLTQGTK